MSTFRERSWKPRSLWGIAAAGAYFLGAAIAFISASLVLENGTTPEELRSLLATYVIIGLLVSGIGQLMRAAAHGATSSGGKKLDGWGKTVGLLGWSLGLVGALMFSFEGTNTPNWVLFAAVIALLVPAMVTLGVALLPRPAQDATPA